MDQSIFSYFNLHKYAVLAALSVALSAAGATEAAVAPFESGTNIMGPEYTCFADYETDVFEHTAHLGEPIGDPTSADGMLADSLTEWNIKTVRIPLSEHCWLGAEGDSQVSEQTFPELRFIRKQSITGTSYRNRINSFSDTMDSRGIKVILDLHRSGPASIITPNRNEVGQHPAPDSDYSVTFWRSVANTFKDDSHVIFDLFNEPNNISWSCWRTGDECDVGYDTVGMEDLLAAVQEFAPDHPVIMSANHWGENLDNWIVEVDKISLSLNTDNVVAGFHAYRDIFTGSNNYTKIDCTTVRCLYTNRIMNRAKSVADHPKYALAITEMGQNVGWEDSESPDPGLDCQSTEFFGALLQWAKLNNTPAMPWAWNPAPCDTPSLQATNNDVDWNGRNRSAYGDTLYAFLHGNLPLNVEIIDDNANNIWLVPGDNTRTWISSGCAVSLESQGVLRSTGTWYEDLAGLEVVSRTCDDLSVFLPPKPAQGEIVDINANSIWYLPGNNTRTWINAGCSASLESEGVLRRAGSFYFDLARFDGVSRSCNDLIISLPPETVQGQIINQDAYNAWFLPGDNTRSWIDPGCAASLETQGVLRRDGSWIDDLANLESVSRSCENLAEL